MCTLTYLPLAKEEFIITTNRDESPKRGNIEFPAYSTLSNKMVIYPKDPLAGGSWVASTDNGITACLLNGAKEPHQHKPPYKLSRGLMLLELMECIRPDEFFKNYDFSGIEPFTLVVFYYEKKLNIKELQWDGEKAKIKTLNSGTPHIWASAQLYNEEAINNRKKWFSHWVQKQDAPFNQQRIIKFHSTAGEGDLKNDLIMDRGDVKTTSITSILSRNTYVKIQNIDLINDLSKEISIAQHLNQEFSHDVL